MIAVDLGATSFKAAALEKEGDKFALTAFGVRPLPPFTPDKRSAKDLGAILKSMMEEIGLRGRSVEGSINPNSAFLRILELPQMPVGEARNAIKANDQRYLHMDCSSFALDCDLLSSNGGGKGRGDTTAGGKTARMQVLVGAVPLAEMTFFKEVLVSAGLKPNTMGISSVASINAFEISQPEVFGKEVVVLVDCGFSSSTMFILNHGTLALTRGMQFNGRRVAQVLARAMNLSEADAQKASMDLDDAAQRALQRTVEELGREIRDSVDFFEQQRQLQVTKVFLSGGFARQPFFLESIQKLAHVPTVAWNPCQGMTLKLTADRQKELESQAPLLAGAIGAAVTELAP